MFCSSCGTQVPDDSIRCTNCGAAMRAGAGGVPADVAQPGGAIKGFFILVGSYFTMPLKTLRLTQSQLREIGAKGSFDISADLPHLNWLRVAGGVLASTAVFGMLLWGVVKAIGALSNSNEFESFGGGGGSVGDRLFHALLYLIVGGLGAVVVDWFVMYLVELISIWVGIANNIKKMADRR
jgi:zinc-ribbon domain